MCQVVLADAVEKDGEEAVQQLQQQFHANICFVKCDVTQSVDIVSKCAIFTWCFRLVCLQSSQCSNYWKLNRFNLTVLFRFYEIGLGLLENFAGKMLALDATIRLIYGYIGYCLQESFR